MNSHNALTVWIALDKSCNNNGGIYYYKKTHKLGLLEHFPSMVPGSSQKLKYTNSMLMFKKTSPKLNPGDCLIHSCAVVHGSNANLSGNPRRGITVRYIAGSARVDKFLRKKYEKELRDQINKRS